MNKKIKNHIYEIIFEADTKPGKLFDIILMMVILFSIFVVILESVSTGIVTAEFTMAKQKKITTQCCLSCLKKGHEPDAIYFRFCGETLKE